MKSLKDLKGTYSSKDISNLVDFTSEAPLKLPENGTYRFEKQGTVVHIYGVHEGIKEYEIGDIPDSMTFNGIKQSDLGVVVKLHWEDIDSVFLHSLVLETNGVDYRTKNTPRIIPQQIGESRVYIGGESRNSGESRQSYNLGESRQFSGESRTIRRNTSSGRESRGGESR